MINVENLSFKYDVEQVLDKISLALEKGLVLAIIGSNGCGKTTFGFCLSGIIPHLLRGHMDGEVSICGQKTAEARLGELIRNIGMVFDDPDSQFVTLRVKDEIAFALENLGFSPDEIRKRIDEVIESGKTTYTTRSDFIKDALRKRLRELGFET